MRPIRPRKRFVPMLATAAILLNFDAAFACTTKQMAYTTAMKSDLRNLVSAQESFRHDNKTYSTDLTQLGFRSIVGVTPPVIALSADSGWTAHVTHAEVAGRTCYIFVGGTRPAGAKNREAAEAEPWCEGGTPLFRDEDLARLTWLFIFALTLTALVFLRRALVRTWAGRILVATSAIFTLMILAFATCLFFPLALLAGFALVALGSFALVLRRAMAA